MKISESMFFVEGVGRPGAVQRIAGPEARHVLLSRRKSKGDWLFLTDGKGAVARACIQTIGSDRNSLDVRIAESGHHAPSVPYRILASAVPKGERQSTMLDMAVQLGICGFVPLECDFSTGHFRNAVRARWHRVLIQSCKQCRQACFPWIGESMTPGQLFDNYRSEIADGTCLVFLGDPAGEKLTDLDVPYNGEVETLLMIVGPEGGFSDHEKSILDRQNVLKLQLSKQTLRTEAAAVALVSAVYQRNWNSNSG